MNHFGEFATEGRLSAKEQMMWTITISIWLTKGREAVTFESAAMTERIEATDLFNALMRQLGPLLNKIQMLRDGVEFLCAYGHPIKVRVVKD